MTKKMTFLSLLLLGAILVCCDDFKRSKKDLLIGKWKHKNGNCFITITSDTIDYSNCNLPFFSKRKYTLQNDSFIIFARDHVDKYNIIDINNDILIFKSSDGIDTSFRVKSD